MRPAEDLTLRLLHGAATYGSCVTSGLHERSYSALCAVQIASLTKSLVAIPVRKDLSVRLALRHVHGSGRRTTGRKRFLRRVRIASFSQITEAKIAASPPPTLASVGETSAASFLRCEGSKLRVTATHALSLESLQALLRGSLHSRVGKRRRRVHHTCRWRAPADRGRAAAASASPSGGRGPGPEVRGAAAAAATANPM